MKNVKTKLLVAAILILIVGGSLGSYIVDSVEYGEYHVKQAAITGKMTVISDPGMYDQMFGTITKYKQAGMLYFSSNNLDGGDGVETQPLKCTFQGNSTADVSGVLKYRLGVLDKDRLSLQKDYGTDKNILDELVRNTVADAIIKTGPLFTPEEAFITRRSEFSEIVKGMIKNGIYKTSTKTIKVERDGKIITEQKTNLYLDSTGNPVISEVSPFKKFGLTITQFNIKDFDFDVTTAELITAKKKAEQTQVLARAEAEKAKQDAITEKEKGKARVAKAKADQEVEKITAVTKAQKEKEVAELKAEQKFKVSEFNEKASKKDAQRVINLGEAEAQVAKLKVRAGLTPLEQATIEKDTRIGVANALSKWVGPKVLVNGGGKNGGGSLSETFMIKNLMDIAKNTK